jgi:hypothetical protein
MAADGKASTRPSALVLVHGVGAVERGDMLRGVFGEWAGEIDDVTIGGEPYARLKAPAQAADELFEVYWADTKPGGESAAARLARPLHVLLALSQIGGQGWEAPGTGAHSPSIFGKLLHIFLWLPTLVAAAVYIPLLYLSTATDPLRYPLALASILPIAGLASILRKLDPWAAAATVAAPLAGLATIIAVSKGWLHPSDGPRITSTILTAVYTVVLVLSTAAFAQVLVAWRRARHRAGWETLLVRAASLILPFSLAGGGLGAVLWALNLWVLHKLEANDLHAWARDYQNALPFDLGVMEFAFAAATFAFGALLVGIAIRFFVKLASASSARNHEQIGRQLRDGIGAALAFLLFANLAVGAVFLINVFWFPGHEILRWAPAAFAHNAIIDIGLWVTEHLSGESGDPVWAIYIMSSARLVSFLPGFIPQLRTPAAIVADVVLFLAPPGALSYRRAACDRLGTLLDHLAASHDICIAAYSQGTAITLETLSRASAPPSRLVTVGSPLESLYERFLGRPAAGPPAVVSWQNFFRPSDYIGGPVAAARNIPIDTDYRLNHLHYFQEAPVRAAI